MQNLGLVSLRPEDLTWDKALRLFSLRCRSQNLSTQTLKLYGVNLNTWRKWIAENGDVAPASIRAEHLRTFLQDFKARGRKDSTVDCVFRIIRTFWFFLEREGLILVNPMRKVERPKRERRLIKAFTIEQARLILCAIPTRKALGLRDFALTALLLDTGLRASEAIGLRVKDLDFGQGILTVVGKGRKERVVPFGQTAKRAILDWLQVRGDVDGVEALWCNRFGRPLAKRTYEDRLRAIGKMAGLENVRCSMHTFRHTFAINYLRNGGDVLTLQKILGHSTLDMTRIYAQMADSDSIERHRAASPLDKMGPLPNERKRVRLR